MQALNNDLKSALEMFYHWEEIMPDAVFLRQPMNGSWKEFTWGEAGRQIRLIAQAIRDQGLTPGDRVAILSKNCAHWILSDLAIMMAGCVSVPLYPTQLPEALEYVLKHSETRVIFVGRLEDQDGLERGIPSDIIRISFPYPNPLPAQLSWEQLVEKSEDISSKFSGNRILPDLQSLATIIYTSGTTGSPKGVMHSYRSMAFAATGFLRHLGAQPKDRLFSYLPLCHVAERALVEMMSLYGGCSISFAESLDTFSSNLAEVSPITFFSVPRLWTKFQSGILTKVPQHKLDLMLRIPGLSHYIRRKIKRALGLQNARQIGSGAAAIAPALLEWYAKLGIEITEGFGQTETFAYGAVNPEGKVRIGSVGKPLHGNQFQIADTGEILLQSEAAMMGYFKDEAASAEALDGLWTRTGDVGRLDADGYLYITGRIKEIFKTDKGKYIAPAPIESKFIAETPHIEQLCVMGAAMNRPVALCVLTDAARKRPQAIVTEDFTAALRRLNGKLDKHERIDHCILVRDEWTVDAGMMTPTMKIKRHSIESRYKNLIAQAAVSKQAIVWE